MALPEMIILLLLFLRLGEPECRGRVSQATGLEGVGAGARAYIRALRTSVMSLYEVSDVVVGESFLARDLVRGGGPVRVFERSATRSLSQWDRIAARVVTVLGRTQISGAVLPFSHPLAEEAVASIERVRKKARGKLAKSLGRNVDEIDFAAVTGVEEILASSAFMFSNLWLNDALGRSLNPTLPQIEPRQNRHALRAAPPQRARRAAYRRHAPRGCRTKP